ncbi:hypothetical protein [Lacrimispora aerotolerans]|uniref:hypothetical protein n=1 Tax=Lacrimispora aerotolerans TaxID=36832 RepID=UPI00047B3B69|nr:hypothetical protein [Lacrimispora aerotolerans]
MSEIIKLSSNQKEELMKQAGMNWEELASNFNDTQNSPELLKLTNSTVVVQGKTWRVEPE